MSLVRVYLPEDFKEGRIVEIPLEELKHLKVRRVKNGTEIILLNGKGMEAKALLKGKEAEIIKVEKVNKELPVKIYLYQGLIKGEKMELIIQKATELGVAEIIPIITERCVVEPKREKLKRWQKIAIEALKQSGRTVLPAIHPPKSLEELRISGPLLVPWEKAEKSFKSILASWNTTDNLSVLIGPEGGLTEGEISYLVRKFNAETVSLGNVILRSETAAIYAISVLRFVNS